MLLGVSRHTDVTESFDGSSVLFQNWWVSLSFKSTFSWRVTGDITIVLLKGEEHHVINII